MSYHISYYFISVRKY